MFSKREEEYLKGSLLLSKNYDKTMKRRINKKIRLLLETTVPLIAENPNTTHWIPEIRKVLDSVPMGTEYRTPLPSNINEVNDFHPLPRIIENSHDNPPLIGEKSLGRDLNPRHLAYKATER